MFHWNVEQGTPEWDAIRRGKVSASNIDAVMSKGKNYRARLVCERLTGVTEDTFSSYDMQRGMELEPAARESYEFLTGNNIIQVGWVDHPTIDMAGCSPDGLIWGDENVMPDGYGSIEGAVEIKCPKAATHLDYMLQGEDAIEGGYIKQMQWQMACCELRWVDFCSYHPSFPTNQQLVVIRIYRDEEMISKQKDLAVTFLAGVDRMVREVKEYQCPA